MVRAATATVFGGTGFLGGGIARQLSQDGWRVRVAVRRPERLARQDNVVGMHADVRDEESVAAAVKGASVVVNAVSLYLESPRNGLTFHAVHEDGAARVARNAANNGADRLIHISGIGADAASPSRFIGARGRGEERVLTEFGAATIVRPSVMFAENGGFLGSLAGILRCAPVFPLIGGGTRLQPVCADDVAELIGCAVERKEGDGETFELGGPEVLTMREIVGRLLEASGLRRAILPVPIPVALLQAHLLELLPSPPLTVAQVELLRGDNVANADAPGFERFGIQPASIDPFIAACAAPRVQSAEERA